MIDDRPLRIGITCYPSVGGSGVLASALGEDLARRGYEVHFISNEQPFRLPVDASRIFFHPVSINDYGLFKYPDYTLPLSVKMAEVSRAHRLDVARAMLPPDRQPRVVTTLHGTDTTLLGRDPGYGPAIRHALAASDAVTTVSEWLRRETQRLLEVDRPIDVIHNFFARPPSRSRDAVRQELGMEGKAMVLHLSNLRPLKRIDLLLETMARVRPRASFKLVILAGADFSPYAGTVRDLGLGDRVIVRERVAGVEDYLQAADLGLYTSDTESFCLSILEGMCFGCPSVATRVGGIPEVVDDGVSGLLVAPRDVDGLARAVERLIGDPAARAAMGRVARETARERFSADRIVPRYIELYKRVCSHEPVGPRNNG